MTWLAEWLKEIIFVVLLATFIDLLLPNRSMERYVKLVVSLLILLTLISPVMRLFAPDAQQKLEKAFMESTDDGAMKTAGTDEILRQGEQMRMKREREALQWASEEAAKRMKEQIERETGQLVERVVVALDAPENGADPAISAIEVYIDQEQEPSNAKDPPLSGRNEGHEQIPIAAVEPVHIQVNLMEDEPNVEESIPAGSSSLHGEWISEEIEPASEGESVFADAGAYERTQQIIDILSRNWGIPRELVHVVIQEDK